MQNNISSQAVKTLVEKAHSTAYPSSIGEFLSQRASKMGDKVLAHWFEREEKITYRQLDKAANSLAQSFLKIGVTKSTHVAVMLPNCKN